MNAKFDLLNNILSELNNTIMKIQYCLIFLLNNSYCCCIHIILDNSSSKSE